MLFSELVQEFILSETTHGVLKKTPVIFGSVKEGFWRTWMSAWECFVLMLWRSLELVFFLSEGFMLVELLHSMEEGATWPVGGG